MLKKILPEVKCLKHKSDSDTNLIRAVCATFICLFFLFFGFVLYNLTLPFLVDKPVLLLFLILLYIPFQFGIMYFSIRMVDEIELLYRRLTS